MVQLPTDQLFIDTRQSPSVFDDWQINLWRLEGSIKEVTPGLYRNNAVEYRGCWDSYVVAQAINPGSYVSTFAMLNNYNFIVDTTWVVESFSKRPHENVGKIGTRYRYRVVDEDLLFGYESHLWNGGVCCVATPEKCLIDMACYFPEIVDVDYLESLRFDREEIAELCDFEVLNQYLERVGSREVSRRIAGFRNALEL